MFNELFLEDFRIFQNQSITLGKTLTAIAGHNATGKSTVLGILGNACELKSKFGTTITDKMFKTEFSELFKGSKNHDKDHGNIGNLKYTWPDGKLTDITLRVTWQKWTSASTDNNRFRILNKWIPQEDDMRVTAKKLPIPSFYLGLSRLYPLGEDSKEIIEEKKFKKKLTQDDLKWLMDNYKNILSLNSQIDSISNYEIDRKRSGGVNTDTYDYLSNSSGQDNLMQIMYLLLSFLKLKDEYDKKDQPWLGGILLIDEIDATLHPAAQIRLVDLIYQVCKRIQIQAVFTTHSLQILQYLDRERQKNDDISIEYFTTANNILQIMHNPTYEAMENDMLISNYYLANNNKRLVIYSEDDEARWFIKRFLKDYSIRVQLVEIKLGGESLMDLLKNDSDYFKNVLFILDGDKDLSKTKYKEIAQKFCNVIYLPGNEGPEALLYQYLLNLPPTHDILSEYFEKGLSIRTFKGEGPFLNAKYQQLGKDRDKYKQWFKDNKIMFEDINLLDYWINDNYKEYEEFVKSFLNSFNIIASRTRIPKLN